jgi:hypothetical protein
MNFLDHGLISAVKPIGGGWRYLQVHQGQTWRIPAEGSAKSAEVLVQQVTDFRVANGIALGDPFADVVDFIRKVSPNNDRWQGRVVGQPRAHEITPLIQDLRVWIDKTATDKPRFILTDEARDRARICMTCPQNIRWELSGCGACNEEIHIRSYQLRQAKTVPPEEDALRGCRLHRIELKAAVHLDRDFLPQRHTDAPPQCWIPQQASTI